MKAGDKVKVVDGSFYDNEHIAEAYKTQDKQGVITEVVTEKELVLVSLPDIGMTLCFDIVELEVIQ